MRAGIAVWMLMAMGCGGKVTPESSVDAAASAPGEVRAFPRAEELATLLASFAEDDRWQGSVVLTQGGEPMFVDGVGHADAAKRQPVDPDTLFRVGSITKTYTATMVFQLVDEGALALDTTLESLIEGIPHGDQITIEQMLDHHSGIASLTDDPSYATWSTAPATQQANIDRIRGYEPAFEPGSKGEYSNSNYVLLGDIVEALDQRTYAESLQARVLDRIGASRTRFGGALQAANNEAQPILFNGKKWSIQGATDLSVPGGAGALVSTPTELCAFAEALFTGTLVSPGSLETMLDTEDDFGHGVFRIPFYDRIAHGHTGGIDTFASMLGYFQDDGTCVALASHTSVSMPVNDVAVATLSMFYDKPYTPPVVSAPVDLPAEQLKAYVGSYTSDAIPLDIAIRMKDGALWAQATGQAPFPLTPTGPTVMEFQVAGIRMEFDDDGGFVLHQGGGAFPYTRVVEPAP